MGNIKHRINQYLRNCFARIGPYNQVVWVWVGILDSKEVKYCHVFERPKTKLLYVISIGGINFIKPFVDLSRVPPGACQSLHLAGCWWCSGLQWHYIWVLNIYSIMYIMYYYHITDSLLALLYANYNTTFSHSCFHYMYLMVN